MHLLLVLLLALCCISAISAAPPVKKEHDMDEGIAFMPGSASGRYEGLTGIRKRRQLPMAFSEAFAKWFDSWYNNREAQKLIVKN